MKGNGLRGTWLWSWQFSADGSMTEQLQLCKDAKAGILIKAIDGRSWQGRFDSSSEGITSAQRAAEVARWFKERGVPVALWSVPRGVNDGYTETEVEMTRDVISRTQDYIEAFVLDVEPFDGFWVGNVTRARRLVRQIRGTVPVYVAPDARPWHLAGSMRAFCEEADGIAPQMYWRTFSGQCGYYRQAGYACARITPRYLADMTKEIFSPFGKPLVAIGQGDSTAQAWSEFFQGCKANGYEGVTSWRQGVTSDLVRRVFAQSSWLGEEEEDMDLGQRVSKLEETVETIVDVLKDLKETTEQRAQMVLDLEKRVDDVGRRLDTHVAKTQDVAALQKDVANALAGAAEELR